MVSKRHFQAAERPFRFYLPKKRTIHNLKCYISMGLFSSRIGLMCRKHALFQGRMTCFENPAVNSARIYCSNVTCKCLKNVILEHPVRTVLSVQVTGSIHCSRNSRYHSAIPVSTLAAKGTHITAENGSESFNA